MSVYGGILLFFIKMSYTPVEKVSGRSLFFIIFICNGDKAFVLSINIKASYI
jgi:hypothetical protein